MDENWLDFKSDFVTVFLWSVKEGLRNTLGETVMLTIVPLLKQPLETYAEKPSELHRELQLYFGFGAVTLERMIVKDLPKAEPSLHVEQRPRFRNHHRAREEGSFPASKGSHEKVTSEDKLFELLMPGKSSPVAAMRTTAYSREYFP